MLSGNVWAASTAGQGSRSCAIYAASNRQGWPRKVPSGRALDCHLTSKSRQSASSEQMAFSTQVALFVAPLREKKTFAASIIALRGPGARQLALENVDRAR